MTEEGSVKRIPKAAKVAAAKLGAARAGEWISGKANPLETVKSLAASFEEYVRIVEGEQTKRRGIAADEKIAVESIRLRRDVLMDYLKRSFDERRETFERLFKHLDSAMEIGDTAGSGNTLAAIVELAKSSPFKGIGSVKELEDTIEKKRNIDF